VGYVWDEGGLAWVTETEMVACLLPALQAQMPKTAIINVV